MKQRIKRSKTQSDQINIQLQRQKSIFNNLNWQIRQKDKKISFLQKYYRDLKRIVNKQQRQSKALEQKIYKYRQRNHFSLKNSPILNKCNDLSGFKNNKKIVTQMQQSQNEQSKENQFIKDHYKMNSPSSLLQRIS